MDPTETLQVGVDLDYLA